jgi:hypothetical protein
LKLNLIKKIARHPGESRDPSSAVSFCLTAGRWIAACATMTIKGISLKQIESTP